MGDDALGGGAGGGGGSAGGGCVREPFFEMPFALIRIFGGGGSTGGRGSSRGVQMASLPRSREEGAVLGRGVDTAGVSAARPLPFLDAVDGAAFAGATFAGAAFVGAAFTCAAFADAAFPGAALLGAILADGFLEGADLADAAFASAAFAGAPFSAVAGVVGAEVEAEVEGTPPSATHFGQYHDPATSMAVARARVGETHP